MYMEKDCLNGLNVMYLNAIVILVLFFGGYMLYKRMFPTIEYIFDIYIIVWIVILLTVGAKDAIFLFR